VNLPETARLNVHDLRGISPLLYGHVNPYSYSKLDLHSRLSIGRRASAHSP